MVDGSERVRRRRRRGRTARSIARADIRFPRVSRFGILVGIAMIDRWNRSIQNYSIFELLKNQEAGIDLCPSTEPRPHHTPSFRYNGPTRFPLQPRFPTWPSSGPKHAPWPRPIRRNSLRRNKKRPHFQSGGPPSIISRPNVVSSTRSPLSNSY